MTNDSNADDSDTTSFPPIILRIYHHATVYATIQVGLPIVTSQQRRKHATRPFQVMDYVRTPQVIWEAYCHSKSPNQQQTDQQDLFEKDDFSEAMLKRAVKDLFLKCHPDKLVHLGNDFRIYYASLAMAAFLKHASIWFQNPDQLPTSVDILEMPLLCITNFEPSSSSCSLPSHFEYLASQQFALAVDKAAAASRRTHLQQTKQLAEQARYAEVLFWDHDQSVQITIIFRILVTRASSIQETDKNRDRPQRMAPMTEKIRVLVQRLQANDATLTEIHLEACDLANAVHFRKKILALKVSKCPIILFEIDAVLLPQRDMCLLLEYMKHNSTVQTLSMKGIFSDRPKAQVEAIADMVRHNTTLQELSFAICGFLTNYTIVYLAKALPHNATLKRLNLMRCANLYSEGVAEIAKALSEEESVSTLDVMNLNGTGMTSKVTGALVAMIFRHSSLQSLDLRQNHFHEMAIQRLREAQQHHPHLQELLVDPPTIAE